MSVLQWMDSAPTSKKLTLLIVMIGLVLCVFYVYGWEPTRTQIEVVAGHVQRLDGEILTFRDKMMKLAELQVGVKELERRLEEEGQASYRDAHRVGLRQKIVKLAENHQLSLVLWRPVVFVEEGKDGVQEYAVEVRVEGGYHRVAKFFTQILHLPQILGISNLKMKVTSDLTQKSLLKTDFVLASVKLSSEEGVSKLVSNQKNQAVNQTGL